MSSLNDKNIDDLVSGYGEEFTPDVERALSRLHGKIEVYSETTKASAAHRQLDPRPRPMSRWLSVAAAVLLLVTFAFFFWPTGGETIANHTDEQLEHLLPDGTKVILQAHTEIAYAKNYNEEARELSLNGQAYFEVVPDPTRPFLVSSGGSTLRVTGTAFNLRVEGEELEVEVSEGSIVLSRDQEQLAVQANECGISKPGKRLRLMRAPNLNRHAWRTGELNFENASLEEVLRCLYVNWRVSTSLEVSGNCDFPISGKYVNVDAAAVLSDLAQLSGLSLHKLENEGQTYELRGTCAN